VAQRRTS
jgi:hypothetical protein